MVDNIFEVFKSDMERSPVLSPSNRAVGSAPTTNETEREVNAVQEKVGEGYPVLNENETTQAILNELNGYAAQVAAADIPEADKERLLQSIRQESENTIAKNDIPLETPWIDPIDIVSGPLAFSKGASKVFGKLTRGVLTGPGVLKLSDGSLVKALTAALVADVTVGQGIEIAEDEMTEADVPWYVQEPIKLGAMIAVGGYAQMKTENAVTAIADRIRKQGGKAPIEKVKKAVKTAQTNLEEELSLVATTNAINNKAAKRDVLEEFKAPKKAKKEKTGKQRATEIKATKTPLFSDDTITNPNKNYAGLEQVKAAGKDIYPESFQEAEAIEEFFTSKPTARKLIAKLKEEKFEGVAEEGFARKFFGSEKPPVDRSKQVLAEAKAHAGANSVTGMVGGTFAGLETNDEGEITGFNIPRSLAVGVLGALGGAYTVKNYSKFIAGVKGLQNTPKNILAAESKLLKETAEKLDVLGWDPFKTALGTGWYKGPEGKLRKYLPNKDAKISSPVLDDMMANRNSYTLNELLDFPLMKDFYSDTVMANTKVVYEPDTSGAWASFNPANDTIYLHNINGDTNKLLESVIHESQHAIQKFEGFSPGTNDEIMGLVFDKATAVSAKPINQRSIEEQQLLNAWTDSLKQLDSQDVAEVKTSMKNVFGFTANNKPQLADLELSHAREVYSNAAYRATYGEVEARVGALPGQRGQIQKMTDLATVADPKMWIQNETLIGPLWDTLSSHQTQNALDANMFISKEMKSKGTPTTVVQRWEDFANKRLIAPFQHFVDSKIYHEGMREQFGINLPRKYRMLLEDYDRQSNRILDHAMTLADKLNRLAPTQKEQKRLMQVLRGGVTSDPELAQAAQQVQDAFKELRFTAQQIGLRSYDMYDAFTKTQRAQLKSVISFSNDKDAVLRAQEALKQHYRAGTSYEYVPTFLKSEEGVTIAERKQLTKRLNKLKATARKATEIYDDEPLPHLRDEIAEIEAVLAVNKNNAFNTNRKQLSKGYVNILAPTEAADLLNKSEKAIRSASFTAARGVSELALDIQRKGFLESVAKNTDWALPKSMPKEYVPAHFTQLKGERYGPLNGMYVDSLIAKDINDLGEVTNEFIRNWDKLLGFWKLGKAVYNPATHVGNFTSNVFLAHLGGVPPSDVKTYAQAAQALQSRMKNKWFKEAEGWGLLNNTFSAAELSQFRKKLSSFRDQPKTVTTGQKVKDSIADGLSYPSALYEKNEQFFKLAVFIKARKQGETIDQAAKKAEEYLFNYRDVPPIVRHYKRWASPFFTFTYKASGLLAKEVVRHPWRLAMWGGAYLGLQEAAKSMTGTTSQQIKSDRNRMPGFGVFDMLLPVKDIDGNRQYWDISRLVPLGQYSEKWGQTGLPVGSVAPTANPLTSFLFELAINKDLFTGQEIYDTDLDGLMGLSEKWFWHLWKEMTPSLAPGNYGYNNLVKGLKSLDRDIQDYTGQEVTMQDMLLRTVLAVKVNSATEEAMNRTFKSEIMRVNRSIGKNISKQKTRLRRGEITLDEYNKIVNKLQQQQQFFQNKVIGRQNLEE